MRVLVLRHHEEDLPGLVGDAFGAHGTSVDTALYPDDGRLPELEGVDHLVILGSSWSVYDPHDWIAREIEWLRDVQVPVLGICFGAQLLAAAFGGRVERSPTYELGWATVDPVPHVESCQEGSPVIGRGPWFQFHGDRCILPATARLLAINEIGVQAFTVGRHMGVQFHPELDVGQLERWIVHGGREEIVGLGKDPDALLAETAQEEPAAKRRAAELVDAYLAFSTHASPHLSR